MPEDTALAEGVDLNAIRWLVSPALRRRTCQRESNHGGLGAGRPVSAA